jgi:hypothetical protein
MLTKLSQRIKKPSIQCKLEMFTDGNDDYTQVLPELYSLNEIDYGQLIKIKENGRLVEKLKRIIYGSPTLEDIETINIENMNSIFRERSGRVVRKTKCFAKKMFNLNSVLTLFHFYWNFMNNYQRTVTPAMLEKVSDHPWSWDEFLTFHTAV